MAALSAEDLSRLPREQLEEMHEALRQHREAVAGNQLEAYRPYGKQCEFHTAGLGFRERSIIAANRIGKTTAGAAEVAMHLTGRYPAWWSGHRFNRAINMIAGSQSGTLTRDGAQTLLLGEPTTLNETLGTGTIPRDTIGEWRAARGIPNGIDTIAVRHASGEWSTLSFKSYDQGRKNWQASDRDLIWFDEEPPLDIYSEGMSRAGNIDDGKIILTATPMLGMSHVVIRFLSAPDKDTRHTTSIGLDDVPDYVMSAQRKRERLSEVPENERGPRLRGEPLLGSGAIYPVAEGQIKVDPFTIPASWPVLGSMDFGYDHPFAAVMLARDPETDTIYVTRCHRVTRTVPPIHALAIKPWGDGLRWAWPRDGLQHSKDSGVPLRDSYKDAGLNMLGDWAQFEDGSVGVEAGLIDNLTRMELGTFKVFSNCSEWFDEMRLYRREAGRVVKENDDLMDATRYGTMAIRHARPLQRRRLADADSGGSVGDYEPLG